MNRLTVTERERLDTMCPAAREMKLGTRIDAATVVTASGSGWIEDLAENTSVRLTVPHADQVEFALGGVPHFDVHDDLVVRLLADGTDGSQFTVEIERPTGAYGYDYGYGGGEADYQYTWERAGLPA